MKKTRINSNIATITLLVGAAVMIFLENYPIEFAVDANLNELIQKTLTRGIGSVAALIIVLYLGYRVHNMRGIGKQLLFAIPCFLVVINNLPIIALITENAYLTSPTSHLIWFTFECLFIGIFEECVFRGALFMLLLEKKRSSTKEIFWTTVVGSAIFGAVHLLNLLGGAGVGPTIMQVGYSFLIGGMCSVVLLKTRNVWLCALLHAIYDFCGFLLPTLGAGSWWDTPTIIITAILAVATTAYMVVALMKITPESIELLFDRERKEKK